MQSMMAQKTYEIQLDTIMEFLKDNRNEMANVNVTSTYSEVLDFYVPIMTGILFDISEDH